jgi:HAD superfamily hydrolase (TIGR01509 family)
MLKALLLDMNGVVVDDMAFHERAWQALAADHGRELSALEFRQQMSGRRNRDNLIHVFGALSDEQIRAYQKEKEEAYRAAFRPHLAALPGLIDLLTQAQASGVRVALATSAPPANIDFVLDGLDLRARFDAVVGEAEVQRAKPDPEIYLLAAQRVGAAPSECIVFEDSLAGVASGQAAGMPVVGLTTTHTASELAHCALVVPDFRGVTVDTLARLVSR